MSVKCLFNDSACRQAPDPESNPILASIHKRNLERLKKIEEQKVAKEQEKLMANEDSNVFAEEFKQESQEMNDRLKKLHTNAKTMKPEEIKAELDGCSKQHAAMNEKLVRACVFLPRYDIRQGHITIKQISDALRKARKDLMPKPKFSFKNRSSSKKSTSAAKEDIPKKEEDTVKADADYQQLLVDATRERFTLNDRKDEKIYVDSKIKNKDMMFSSLINCTVSVSTVTTALRIDKVENCTFLIGPIAGSVHIEQAKNCTFVLATRQLRVHFCTDSSFYLFALSKPIIEDTSRVLFAPYNLKYSSLNDDMVFAEMSERENLYDQVQDFHWLKTQHSPNWGIMPFEDRIVAFTVDETQTASE